MRHHDEDGCREVDMQSEHAISMAEARRAERLRRSGSPESAEALARDFLDYCRAHPDLRFWQALCTWSGQSFIIAREQFELRPGVAEYDTWNWKGKGPTE